MENENFELNNEESGESTSRALVPVSGGVEL